jgi:hypothetical protein
MRATFLFTAVLVLTSSASAGDDPRAVIERAIAASGGADKLARQRAMTWKAKGTMTAGQQRMKYVADYRFAEPDMYRFDLVTGEGPQKITLTAATDGQSAWEQMNDQRRDMAVEKAAEFHHNVYLLHISRLLPLRGREYTLAAVGDHKHGDRTLTGVKVSRPGKRDVSLYFDPATHLLVKSTSMIRDEFQNNREITQDVIYEGVSDAAGTKVPMKLTIYRGGKPMIVEEYSGWEFAEKADPTRFAKP